MRNKILVITLLQLCLVACGKTGTDDANTAPVDVAVPIENFKGVVAPFCFGADGEREPCVDVYQNTGACGEDFVVGGETAYIITNGLAIPIANGEYQWTDDGCVIKVQNQNTWDHP